VDLDGDGRSDVISGSWPGEIYFFRRESNGKFAAGVPLKGGDGKPINVGAASAAFAADWNGTGAMDLIIGTVLGEVWVIPNESKGKGMRFGTPRRLEAGGTPIKVGRDAGPVVADWDGDGKLDLILGADDGSVVWFRNVGTRGAPNLEAARTLVVKSPVGWGSDGDRGPHDWGLRVKPCVFDWDDDGRPDLLLGDLCMGKESKPSQREEDKEEERRANEKIPELRAKWADAFRSFKETKDASSKEKLRAKMTRLNEELTVVEEIQARYQPGYQCHGFVWLFQRKRPVRNGLNP
jgi:FG-GAP-like repeat